MFIDESELINRLHNKENLLGTNRVSDEPIDENVIASLVDGVVLNRIERKIGTGNGRVVGDRNIPPIFREIIGVQGTFEKNKDVAKAFGVSPQTVSNLSNGRVNQTGNETVSDIIHSKALEKHIGTIRSKAMEKMEIALDLIDKEKLEEKSAKELSVIASNLANVIGRITKKDDGPVVNNFQTVFFSPENRGVEQFKTIEA